VCEHDEARGAEAFFGLFGEKFKEDLHAFHIAEQVRAVGHEDGEHLEALDLELARLLTRVFVARNMLIQTLVEVQQQRTEEDGVRCNLCHARLILRHQARNINHGAFHLKVLRA